jgi:DNA mismatch repair protein MutS2
LALAKGATDEAQAKEARRILEEGVRAEARRLDEPEELPVGAGERLAVGARVRLTTGSTGEVVELRSDGKAVVVVGTMRLVVTAKSLLVLAPERQKFAPKSERSGADEPTREAAYEIDLRGMRADESESMVHAAIDGATLAEQPHLRIIHGMGTGVLRDVVHRLLKQDSRVASFEFAPRQQGGTGVTIAVFK